MDFFDAHNVHPYLLLIGCVICPRFVIAIMSLAYWNTNPVLVVFAWLFAFAHTAGAARKTVRLDKHMRFDPNAFTE